jgi:hypothetical protein
MLKLAVSASLEANGDFMATIIPARPPLPLSPKLTMLRGIILPLDIHSAAMYAAGMIETELVWKEQHV